jgi:hypothetical protein
MTDISETKLAYLSNIEGERLCVPNDQRVHVLGTAAATHNTEPSVNYSLIHRSASMPV